MIEIGKRNFKAKLPKNAAKFTISEDKHQLEKDVSNENENNAVKPKIQVKGDKKRRIMKKREGSEVFEKAIEPDDKKQSIVSKADNDNDKDKNDKKTDKETNNNNKADKKPSKKRERHRRKKESFYNKVAKKRIDDGKIILSQKVETKIYKLKKALKKKGLPEEEVKDIIRKKRREEELKYRKVQKTLCFKCRKPGHTLADCPMANGHDESHDICYFCGSAEHKLHECCKYKQTKQQQQQANNRQKTIELPFVKCFVCGKNGHLTRDCKDNENGAFPKGGKCILCGSVNHMVKDCPREGDKKPDVEINLGTYDMENGNGNIDADDFHFQLPVQSSTQNNKTPVSGSAKAKIVKF